MVVAIGVIPNTEFLVGSGIELSEGFRKGVEVNKFLQTNHPDIYSAGDCATVEWFNGVRRPEQLWYTGRDQGVLAAQNMLGDKKEYVRGTLYNSAKLFDVEYTTAGLVNFPLEGLSEWYQERPDKCISQRITLQDGAIIGFNALGSRWDHSYFTRWIEERRPLDWILEHMKEAVFDAEFATPFKVLPNAETYDLPSPQK